MSQKQLWIPPSAVRHLAEHKKAPPPKMGEAPGTWAGKDQLASLHLPGGGILQFDLSRLTLGDYRSMRDHYQVNISLALLTFMLHQIDWRIECDDAKIKADVEQKLDAVWTQIARAASQAYWAGYSPISIGWENDLDGRQVNFAKFKDLIPEYCRVNWKQVLGYAPPDHPKPKMNVFDGIKDQGLSWPIPATNSLWYPLLMENGDHYGRKLLRPAFPAWFFSQLMHLFSNRYFERFGEPLPIGRAPFDDELADGQGNFISGKKAMENILTNIRNRSVVVLPNDIQPQSAGSNHAATYDYEIEYLESQMRGADFERYMTRLDEEISLALFTPLLLVRTADVGSYNLGTAHMQTYLWMHNALAADFGQYLQKYVLDRYVDMNYSPRAARAKWRFKPGGKIDPETVRAIISALMGSGSATVDLEALGIELGMNVKQIQQVTAPPDDPNAPAPPKAGPAAAPDPRAGRVRNDTKVRTTRKQITARLADQITKQFRDDTFGDVRMAMGYRKQFEVGLMETGLYEPEAKCIADSLYSNMNAWLTEVSHIPTSAFRDADEVIGMFDRLLESEVDSLVT